MPSDYSKPLTKFKAQRQQAKQRGIEWLLTFEQWWEIWQQSGMYLMRGCGRSRYVMARTGDVGPYSVDNVRICLFAENIQEARENGRFPKIWNGGLPVGHGRGWTFIPRNKKNPYQVMVKRRYVGVFPSQEAAEAAYQAAVAASRSESGGVDHASSFAPHQPLMQAVKR